MNKIVLILFSIGVVVLIGGFYFIIQEPTAEPNVDREVDGMSQKMEVISNVQEVKKRDAYIEYSPDVFQTLSEDKKVLFFYASWCPTCKAAEIDFESNINRFPENLVLVRVNYNDPSTDENEKALAAQYEITYQHTFVQIDEDGHEITKWNGGETDELLKRIK